MAPFPLEMAVMAAVAVTGGGEVPGSEAAATAVREVLHPSPRVGGGRGHLWSHFRRRDRRAKAMARKNLASAQVTEVGRAPPAPGAQRRVQGGEGGGVCSSCKYGCEPRALWPQWGRIDTIWSDVAAGPAGAAWRTGGGGARGIGGNH